MQNIKVAVIQSDIVWENKEKNYKNYQQKIQNLASDINLIVMPEMFNTGFIMHPITSPSHEVDIIEWMYSQVKGKDCAIVGSAATFTDSDKIANRLYFVTSDKTVHTYDKNHLFIHAGEDKKYVSGKKRKIIEYKSFRILLSVCFDLRFPVFNCNANDYDVLLNVACWPESRRGHWQALLKARAIENQAFVIACNRVGNDPNFSYAGDSIVIDYNGDVLAHAKFDETILISCLDKNKQINHREKFNFLKSQDSFILNL